ncbi:hypothetical protein Lal_00037252 [Lupinus albus]|nr:hypothetical protein Lal_00037252 [Lupinus albus]
MSSRVADLQGLQQGKWRVGPRRDAMGLRPKCLNHLQVFQRCRPVQAGSGPDRHGGPDPAAAHTLSGGAGAQGLGAGGDLPHHHRGHHPEGHAHWRDGDDGHRHCLAVTGHLDLLQRRDCRCAGQFFQSADLAHRGSHSDLAWLEEDRAGPPCRSDVHRAAGQAHGGHRLRPGHLRTGAGSLHAQQYGARRRHRASHHEVHCQRLRFRSGQGHAEQGRHLPGAGQLSRQSDHLRHVPHRHRAQSAGGQLRGQGHRPCAATLMDHLGAVHAAARSGVPAAHADGDLPALAAGIEVHAQCGGLRPQRAGQDGPARGQREGDAGDLCTVAAAVGQRPGHAARCGLHPRSHGGGVRRIVRAHHHRHD